MAEFVANTNVFPCDSVKVKAGEFFKNAEKSVTDKMIKSGAIRPAVDDDYKDEDGKKIEVSVIDVKVKDEEFKAYAKAKAEQAESNMLKGIVKNK